MVMKAKGLVKLTEEACEVGQVAMKLVAYPELQNPEATAKGWLHPDGTDLRQRLVEEMGDALAAIEFVTGRLGLSRSAISDRMAFKFALFEKWDREPAGEHQ